MKNLIINIGLTVGTIEPTDQLEKTRNLINELFDFCNINYRVESGQWLNDEGVLIDERVFIVRVNVGSLKKSAVELLLTSLAILLYQDAIAYKLNGEGHLVYNPAFGGELQDFNQEFFKEF